MNPRLAYVLSFLGLLLTLPVQAATFSYSVSGSLQCASGNNAQVCIEPRVSSGSLTTGTAGLPLNIGTVSGGSGFSSPGVGGNWTLRITLTDTESLQSANIPLDGGMFVDTGGGVSASFDTCEITLGQNRYVLSLASGSGWQSAPVTMNVVASTVTGATLRFLTQPAHGVMQRAITPAPIIALVGQDGTTVTTYNGTIRLSLWADAGQTPMQLSSSSATLVNGIATLSGLKITGDSLGDYHGGTGYTLHATSDDNYPGAASQPFDIEGMYRLHFRAYPAAAAGANALWFPQPVIEVLDDKGTIVTDYNGPIKLSAEWRTPSGVSTIVSTDTANADHGVATFSGYRAKEAGDYWLSTYDAEDPAVGTMRASNGYRITAGPAWSDVTTALSLAAGLAPAVPPDLARSNTVPETPGATLEDVVRLARIAAGLDT